MSIAYAMRLGLGPTNPELTNIALGILGLTACGILTHIIATYSDILTCHRSSTPLGIPSTLMTTLPYHFPTPEGVIKFVTSVVCLSPVNFRRRFT